MALGVENRLCTIVCVLHLVLILVIGLALEVRYGYYGDERITLLPGEFTISRLKHGHIFCTSRNLHAFRQTKRDFSFGMPEPAESNAGSYQKRAAQLMSDDVFFNYLDWKRREEEDSGKFDVYTLDYIPAISQSRRRIVTYRLDGDVQEGDFIYHSFCFLSGSTVTGELHARSSEQHAILWLYVFKDTADFNRWQGAHHNFQNAHNMDSIFYKKLSIRTKRSHASEEELERAEQANLESSKPESFEISIADSGEYYFVYYLPPVGLDDSAWISVTYEMNYTTYNLGGAGPPVCTDALNCSAPATELIFLDMGNYRSSDVFTDEDLVLITGRCEPNVLLYVGIFCIAPLLAIAFVVYAFCLWRQRQRDDCHLPDYFYEAPPGESMKDYGSIANSPGAHGNRPLFDRAADVDEYEYLTRN